MSPGCFLGDSWVSPGYSGLSPGCSWLLLAAPGCSWLLRAAPGTSWLLLAAPGCPWLLFAVPGFPWLFLAAPGCSWLRLAASGCPGFLWTSPKQLGAARSRPGSPTVLNHAHFCYIVLWQLRSHHGGHPQKPSASRMETLWKTFRNLMDFIELLRKSSGSFAKTHTHF